MIWSSDVAVGEEERLFVSGQKRMVGIEARVRRKGEEGRGKGKALANASATHDLVTASRNIVRETTNTTTAPTSDAM